MGKVIIEFGFLNIYVDLGVEIYFVVVCMVEVKSEVVFYGIMFKEFVF